MMIMGGVSPTATFLRLLLFLCHVALLAYAGIEAPDGTVCFNQCSGHGECRDYTCHCHPGFGGDDCSTSFVDDHSSQEIVPILTAGHFNLTNANVKQVLRQYPLLLIGFSSYSCYKCIQAEAHYQILAANLTQLKVPFARANVDELKSLAAQFEATTLPALVFVRKQRHIVYKGLHAPQNVLQFVHKLLGPPVKKLHTVAEVNDFLNSRHGVDFSLASVMTVGFFSAAEDIEEDEYDDFVEVAKALQVYEDLHFGAVVKAKVADVFKRNKTIDRTPSVLMVSDLNQRHAINLNEFFDQRMGLKEWILSHSLPLVGKITPQNFMLYEKCGRPMLLLFLDLTDELSSSQPGRIVGGKSGEILNEILVEEVRVVAREYSDKLVFGYLDGNLYEDQMKTLGLLGGKERLPALAFNTHDGTQVPFPEEWPINRDTLNQFCADFLSGRLRSPKDVALMAGKALQRIEKLNPANKARRKAVRKDPAPVQGVAEAFGDRQLGDDQIVTVTLENFDDVAMAEDKDVVLLFHAQGCEPCAHFAVYYKRMALRFADLQVPSLVIARMDLTTEAPPAKYNMVVSKLPIMLMLPAGEKHAPWSFYSGVSKVQSMMRWVHERVSHTFPLPNLPHLTEEQRQMYKDQVREREEYREKQRIEAEKAMEEEDAARAAVLNKQSADGSEDEVDQDNAELEDHDEF